MPFVLVSGDLSVELSGDVVKVVFYIFFDLEDRLEHLTGTLSFRENGADITEHVAYKFRF